MFCQNCGYEIGAEAKFCPQCGTARGGAPRPAGVEDNSFKFSLRPVFILKLHVIRSLPVLIFFLFWAGGFFGGIGAGIVQAINSSSGLKIPMWTVFVLVEIGVLILAIFVLPHFTRKNVENTVYNIYGDRIEYSESFFNKAFKTVKLSRVLCVNMTRGVLQQKYGLGSLCLDTAGTGHHAGIVFQDIPNPEKAYREIQELIENNKAV